MEELQKINIIYEDNHLLVVEKPINIPVCADSSKDDNLLDMLKRYLKVTYNKPGNVYLGLVHRLDRPVGGIMVFAKTSKAASRLSRQVQDRELEKIYYAVVEGRIDGQGEFVDYLVKNKTRNISMVSNKEHGKEARLHYQLMAYKKGKSLVKIRLDTGRSHQIRVQFSSRGLPLIGDAKYNDNRDKKTNIALFAKKLEFRHPISKEKMVFELELPKRYPFDEF